MGAEKVEVRIESGDRGRVFLEIPFDPHARWGKKARHHVKGTLNGHAFEGSLGVRGGKVFMPVNKELQEGAGVAPGDLAKLVIDAAAPAAADVPADLGAALAGEDEARAFFEALSPFCKKEYVKWIEEAKKPETRATRVAKTLTLLKEKKKQR